MSRPPVTPPAVAPPPTFREAMGTFFRAFLVQSSWNYRTMIGTGFGFAMLPGLERLFGGRPDELEAAVGRHLEHFNAHPYLSNVALGASLRMEADGASPDTIRRFKVAVRGPLGSIGDALVWATWLPLVSMAAMTLYWLGLPGPWTVAIFLVMYNTGHLALRIWGFKTGLETGRDVAGRLAGARFAAWTMRLRSLGVMVLGVLAGAVLGGDGGLADAGGGWAVLAVVGFVLGLNVGHHVWRPAAVAVVAAIAILATWGTIR